MPRTDVGQNPHPGHLIRRLQQISVAIFIDETAGFDITPVQYASLLAVQRNPGIDQASLMRLVALDRTSIGEVVVRLEKKGLIKRANGQTDRRMRVLTITAAGRSLLTKLESAVETAQATILKPLTAPQRRLFVKCLKVLVDEQNERSRAPVQPYRSRAPADPQIKG